MAELKWQSEIENNYWASSRLTDEGSPFIWRVGPVGKRWWIDESDKELTEGGAAAVLGPYFSDEAAKIACQRVENTICEEIENEASAKAAKGAGSDDAAAGYGIIRAGMLPAAGTVYEFEIAKGDVDPRTGKAAEKATDFTLRVVTCTPYQIDVTCLVGMASRTTWSHVEWNDRFAPAVTGRLLPQVDEPAEPEPAPDSLPVPPAVGSAWIDAINPPPSGRVYHLGGDDGDVIFYSIDDAVFPPVVIASFADDKKPFETSEGSRFTVAEWNENYGSDPDATFTDPADSEVYPPKSGGLTAESPAPEDKAPPAADEPEKLPVPQVAIVSIDLIDVVHNPRSEESLFGPELDLLATNITEQGLIDPVKLVSLPGGRFRLIDGERRYRAAKAAKLASLRAEVYEGLSEIQILRFQGTTFSTHKPLNHREAALLLKDYMARTGKTITAAGVIAKLWSVGLIRRALFLVDRDALAIQTVKKFKNHLGDNFNIERATGTAADKHRDILVTTIQHLAVRGKYQAYAQEHFGLVVLDECHRSYFGDWYGVLEHFANGGAVLLGLTATPADRETVNTDRFFTDPGQYRGPIYRYTIRQGEANPEVPEWERLAACIHHKFHTNVDLEGVHDMGFDYEPEQLGRAVDVPQRNRLIAEKYFEDILGTRQPVKTMVFAASIAHAKNLRYALIEEYNRRNNLPPNDAAAERFIVAVHNEMPAATDLIEEFQKVTDVAERRAIIDQAHKNPNMALRPIVLVGVGMLDTGIDAPDVEVLLMARPTKSKVLYVQMKGRGTRKCKETGKDIYKLVDFVDITRLEPTVTNDTPGVVDEPVEQEEEDIVRRERGEGGGGHSPGEEEDQEGSEQEMVIADVPVHLVFSETISPAILEELRRQVEAQLKGGLEREGLKQRFSQTILCWRYFKGTALPDHAFLATLGFDLSSLRDLFGEPESTLEDFIAVATGEADFDALRQRRAFEKWALGKKLTKEQRELVVMVCDFKRANPDITPTQVLRSQLLDQVGGPSRVKALFGSIGGLVALADEALTIETGAATPEDEQA